MAEEAGTLYYFNSTPQNVELLLNKHALNLEVAGVKKSASYAPTAHAATRDASDKPNRATFGEQNTLSVSFPIGGGNTYDVEIPPAEYPFEEDLSLYIFYNQLVLVNSKGKARSGVITGTELSEAEAKELMETADA